MKKWMFAILVFFVVGGRGVGAIEDTTSFNLRVMFVKLSPVENGEDMIGHFFGGQFQGKTTDQALDLGIEANINAFKRLSGGKINYEVVKKLDISTFPRYTNGFSYDFAKYLKCANRTEVVEECERQKFYFDYIDWAKSNNICQLAADNNIDEIWMASPPYIATWENFMIGPKDGFNISGGVYVLPECERNYAVMGSGWGWTRYSFPHIYGHRVEATMKYITQNWRDDDRNSYWEDFAAMSLYNYPYGNETTIAPREPFCGNSHFPHNAVRHYDTANKTYKVSTCRDWKNIPNFEESRESVNCNKWSCTDFGVGGWGEYWMGSMPREQGELNLVSNHGIGFTMKNNWWYYLLYPEDTIVLVKEILGVSAVTPTSTKTPLTPINTFIVPEVTLVLPTSEPVVSIRSEKEVGDANSDKRIDIADFGIWKTEFISKTDGRADFDGDGKVSILDFGVWKVGFLMVK